MDQATRLRERIERLRNQISSDWQAGRVRRTVAITSGKGGVGKTSIAVNLSLAWAQKGQRVLLLDADLGMANANLLLNVQTSYSLMDVIQGECSLEEALWDSGMGLQLLSGGSAVSHMPQLDPAQSQHLLNEVGRLRGSWDALVIDTAAGASPGTLAMVAAADDVCLVTTPEPTAFSDAYAVLKLLHARDYQGTIHLVVNQAQDQAEGQSVARRFNEVSQQFLSRRVNLAGVIPKDLRVSQAVMEQVPFTFRSPFALSSRSVHQLARTLEGTEQDGRERQVKAGRKLSRVFGKIVSWLGSGADG